jgi:drug/metabolite transporter (DMT)-like permease
MVLSLNSVPFAAAPFVSEAIAWIWLRERPTKVVLVSSLIAFTGVLIVISGSLGSLHLRGDLLALWMTIAMSIYMFIYRRYPTTPDPMAASYEEIFIMASFGLVFSVA